MRYPQILVVESDRVLATSLQELAQSWRWVLREVRSSEEVLRLMNHGPPTVLVLKLGRDLTDEMTLLQRVAEQFSDAQTIVVGESDHRSLAGMAWDLGAAYVLIQPYPRDWLVELVEGLMGVMEVDDETESADAE